MGTPVLPYLPIMITFYNLRRGSGSLQWRSKRLCRPGRFPKMPPLCPGSEIWRPFLTQIHFLKAPLSGIRDFDDLFCLNSVFEGPLLPGPEISAILFFWYLQKNVWLKMPPLKKCRPGRSALSAPPSYATGSVATAGDFSLDLGFLTLVWGSGDFFWKSALFWSFFAPHGIYIFKCLFFIKYHGFSAILQRCDYN